MEAILSLIKSYFVLMLLLLLLTHLAPKESYKKYFQFFIGAWMCVLLLRPVLGWFRDGEALDTSLKKEVLEEIQKSEKWNGAEVDLYELYKADTEEKE